ncbi:2-succinyl-6-hydroxy-2,4-cyclohexadiene-1-carboxylate synthase [Sporosarcina sp. FSL K6-1522]|uniref:2-succinyl-6-hydroxy-2, 4-cyclohexadiene-1-carboxylate synthase n=1 Tax=Sporosarcina sp. FSL K6-1522 TaxID=2921554 RepID=UPI00315A8004
MIVHVRGLDIHVVMNGEDHLPTIVLLHGFTGSTTTWQETMNLLAGKCRTVAIDLTGHGKTTAPEDYIRYAMAEQVVDLEELFERLALDSFMLVGYSMGGRVALAYTTRYPARVSSLILESSSPGLRTEEARASRREADSRLADRMVEEGLPAFIDFWESIPLFATQKTLSLERRQAVRKERLSQRVNGLANSLRGIGTGSQPSYWKALETVQVPVLLITGELDTKFVTIAREMINEFQNVRHETIEHAGHAIHVEKPLTFVTMIEKHILKSEN